MYHLRDWVEEEVARLPHHHPLYPYMAAELRSSVRHLQRLVGALFDDELTEQERAARELADRLPGFLDRHPSSVAAWREEILPVLRWAEGQHRHVAVPARQAQRLIQEAATSLREHERERDRA